MELALWHVSEDGSIPRFEPRANLEHDSSDALVWAIDSEHTPAYWFPRDMPRGTFWAVDTTTDQDVERFLTGDRKRRVHAIEASWLDALRGIGSISLDAEVKSAPIGALSTAEISTDPTVPDLRAALEAARAETGPVVIATEVDRYEGVPDYDSWWDVAVAEVSEVATVRAARERYEAQRVNERSHI